MKKLGGIIILILIILVGLAFTVPTKKDYEEYIVEKIKEETHDDVFGLNDLLIKNLANFVFLGSEYKDVKVGSTYAFSLGEGKDYKFVGFGTMIICVEGDLSILNKN